MHVARLLLGGSAVLLSVGIAVAGAPLKGVDVKLGRNPGGFVNARVSATGEFSFPVMPAGTYEIEIVGSNGEPVAVLPAYHLVVHGVGKPLDQVVQAVAARKSGAVVAAHFKVVSDGRTAITGSLTSFP